MTRGKYFLFFLGIVSFLFFMLGYSYIKKEVISLHQLSQLEKQLYQNKQRLTLSSSNQQPIESYEFVSLNTNILMTLIHGVEKHSFFVQTLQPLPIKRFGQVNILPIKMTLLGDIHQIDGLLDSFFENHFTVGFKLFSFTVDEKGSVTIDINLLLLNMRSAAMKVKKNSLPDPNLDNQNVSIDQLKYVGFLHNEHYFFALIKLPNGKTETVQVGDAIGIEKANITSITEDEVLLVSRQQQKQLHFASS